jgi:hypothetical protein
MKEKDFTPTGVRIEGAYENDRNQDSRELFQDIIREVYGVQDVIIGHHLVYQTEYKDEDGFTIQLVEEIPSADALIFDHAVIGKLFGEVEKNAVLTRLALEPCETRDAVLKELYYGRSKNNERELGLSATN